MISLKPSLITEHHSVSSLNDNAREASPCSRYLRPARDVDTTCIVGRNVHESMATKVTAHRAPNLLRGCVGRSDRSAIGLRAMEAPRVRTLLQEAQSKSMDSNSILTVVNRAGGHSCGLHCPVKAASGEAAVVGAQGEAKVAPMWPRRRSPSAFGDIPDPDRVAVASPGAVGAERHVEAESKRAVQRPSGKQRQRVSVNAENTNFWKC